MRLKDIAAIYDVTEPAVYRALERAGLLKHRVTFKEFLPWEVMPQHKTTAVMERLRTMLRKHNGEETTETQERLLHEWLEGLRRHQLVVNYHPEAPPNAASSKGGFYYAHRVDEDGDSLLRTQAPLPVPAPGSSG